MPWRFLLGMWIIHDNPKSQLGDRNETWKNYSLNFYKKMGPGSSYKWGQKSHNPYKWQSIKKGFTGVKQPGVISPPFIYNS